MQAEQDIEREKIETIEKKKKIEKNLKLFNVFVENGHNLTELPIPDSETNHDECIESIHCEGGCEKVSQLRRLNSMKQLGNSRSCPQSKSDKKTIYNSSPDICNVMKKKD